MTYFIPISMTSDNADPITMADGDDLYVAENVTVTAPAGHAVYASGGGHQIDIHGVLASTATTLYLVGDATTSIGTSVKIAESGHVINLTSGGIAGIYLSGSSSTIENHGEVYGVSIGIDVFGSSSTTKTTISNFGSVSSDVYGIQHEGAETLVLNNTGSISGDINSFYSYDSSSDRITNSGTMSGDIHLGDGANSYDGRLGHVVGTIFGGAGIDTIRGGTENNVIDGGAGADVMYGGKGNDTFIVDNIGDKVIELDGEGTDLVKSSVNFSLAGQSVDRLTLTGADSIDGTGNSLKNIIIGNDAANHIDGGKRADILFGGAGADTFTFSTALGSTNVDRVVDFVAGTDKFALNGDIFAALSGTTLTSKAFYVGTAAHDGNDHIIYDKAHGALFYDADGTGSAKAVQFASLDNHAVLVFTDFAIV